MAAVRMVTGQGVKANGLARNILGDIEKIQ